MGRQNQIQSGLKFVMLRSFSSRFVVAKQHLTHCRRTDLLFRQKFTHPFWKLDILTTQTLIINKMVQVIGVSKFTPKKGRLLSRSFYFVNCFQIKLAQRISLRENVKTPPPVYRNPRAFRDKSRLICHETVEDRKERGLVLPFLPFSAGTRWAFL
jgi:hypothetical protein